MLAVLQAHSFALGHALLLLPFRLAPLATASSLHIWGGPGRRVLARTCALRPRLGWGLPAPPAGAGAQLCSPPPPAVVVHLHLAPHVVGVKVPGAHVLVHGLERGKALQQVASQVEGLQGGGQETWEFL